LLVTHEGIYYFFLIFGKYKLHKATNEMVCNFFLILCQLLFARGHYKAKYLVLSLRYSSFAYSLLFLPAQRYASVGNSYRNVSVRLSVCLSHAAVLCQKRKS